VTIKYEVTGGDVISMKYFTHFEQKEKVSVGGRKFSDFMKSALRNFCLFLYIALSPPCSHKKITVLQQSRFVYAKTV